MRDSIYDHFGDFAIDFWTSLAMPNYTIDPIFDSGDGTHLNDTAHYVFSNRVIDAEIPEYLYLWSPAVPGGSPLGGIFTGLGVSGDTFYPAIAGVGSHTLNYLYTDANGCADDCNFTITVNPLPSVTCPANQEMCIDATVLDLTTLGATPLGGTFSGSGVSGNSFDPGSAGSGIHTISYSFIDGNGCANVCNFTITVFGIPAVSCPGTQELCSDGSEVDLTTLGATPTSGTFTGPYLTANFFNPALAGAGQHIINYSVTDANGCTNACNFNIFVNDPPQISIDNVNDVSCFGLSELKHNSWFGGQVTTGAGLTVIIKLQLAEDPPPSV
jgi:hypothetical protein